MADETEQPDFAGITKAIGAKYKALAPHIEQFAIGYGDPAKNIGGGKIEFYPPWESENPNPGKPSLMIFDKDMRGDPLQNMIAADMLHYLAAVNPETGKPVDPEWRNLRHRLMTVRGSKNLAMDRKAYEDAKKDPKVKESRSFADWVDDSRADAYVRGYLLPDERDEWRRGGAYSPEMTKILKRMKGYLEGGK